MTVEFLEEHSFSVPVMVLRRDGLGMTLPPSSFSVTDVEHYIGKVFKTFPRKSVYTLSTLYLFHRMKQQLSHALKLFGFVLIAGADKEIDVIDVSRQCDLKMRLGDFVEYYNSPNRERVLNVISLEFSETRYTSISTSLHS